MRLRALAVCIALITLGACDQTPVGTDAADLVAGWVSDVVQVTAATPDGQRSLERTEHWLFEASGRYQREAVLFDRAAGRTYFEYADQGSWAVARPGVVELTPELEFYTSPLQPSASPVLQPASGFEHRYAFEVRGDWLSVTFICPPNALCVRVSPLPLHRAPTLFD